MNNRDNLLYDLLQEQLDEEDQVDDVSPVASAFEVFVGSVIHVVFKAITLIFFLFRTFIEGMFSEIIGKQLIFVFAVFDFWFVKNVSGKKLISLRWFFQSDQYGVSKFMFQCRVNQQRQNHGAKIFWLIQVFYTVLPTLLMILSLIQAPFVFIDFQRVFIAFGILVGAGTNLFYFFQANKGKLKAQNDLKKKLGMDLIRRLQNATVVTFM